MFRAMVKTQHNVVIKCFRSYLSCEYTSNQFSELLSCDGTIHQSSCANTPQQNDIVERKHSHIVETTRSLLFSASIPSEFSGEAILTDVHAINQIPSSVTSCMSPFQKLYGVTPEYPSLKVLSSTCFVLLPQVERNKLYPRSTICVFLGYGMVNRVVAVMILLVRNCMFLAMLCVLSTYHFTLFRAEHILIELSRA